MSVTLWITRCATDLKQLTCWGVRICFRRGKWKWIRALWSKMTCCLVKLCQLMMQRMSVVLQVLGNKAAQLTHSDFRQHQIQKTQRQRPRSDTAHFKQCYITYFATNQTCQLCGRGRVGGLWKSAGPNSRVHGNEFLFFSYFRPHWSRGLSNQACHNFKS